MADIAINPVTRRVQFNGNTGLGPFAFTFNILQNTDIVVYKNATLLTLTTDYTVTINVNGTGSVTLTGSGNGTALISADFLTIVGGRELSRTTDFVTAGDLLASSLNEQLDSNVIMVQQLDEKIDRTMRIAQSDVTADMTLPVKADRVDAVLAFDTDGNPIKGPTVSGITTITDLAADIATLADIEDGTVATDAISDTATVVSDIPTVAGVASDVSTVAGISSDVTTVAANLSGITAFAAVYSSGPNDPTTGLNEGDLFFNTTSDKFKIYNGSSWRDASALDFYSETAFNAASNPNSLSLGFGAGPFTSKGIALGGSDATVKISGAYTLPKTDGTNGQVLTTDGSGAVTFEDVSTAGALPLAGGTMTGDLTLSGTTKAIFGTNDLEIFNQGSPGFVNKITSTNGNNIILDTTGNVIIQGATAKFQGPTGDNGITFTDGGGVSVFHNDVQKLNTESSGINIDGNLTLTGTVDGADIAQNIPASLGTAGQVLTVNSGATATEWASSGSGDLLAANNLSDVSDASTSRTNLGVAIGSDVQAHSSVLDGTTASFTTAKDSKLTGIEAGATADQTGAEIKAVYEAEANAFTDAQFTKLAGIEASADVTGTANVTAAGALMDSEVTNLAQVKAFDSSDYATAAQGATADAALPRTGGAMTGAITTNSTFDGRDVAVDGAKLDGIEASADVTDAGNVNPLVDAHLNTSTASASEVLSWTGTDYDWVAQSGGGGADLYAANESSPAAQPSATGANAIAIGDTAVSSGIASLALGRDSIASATESITLGTGRASGTESVAIGIGINSTTFGTSATYGIAIGRTSRAHGSKAIAIGSGGANSSGANTISIGQNHTSSSSYAVSIGFGHTSSALNSYCLGFGNVIDSGANSAVAFGSENKANTVAGKFTYGPNDTVGSGEPAGSPKAGMQVIVAHTTDATSTVMTTPNTAGQATLADDTTITLPNNSAFAFHGTIVGRQKASEGTASAAWKIEGLIRREGSAATTVLVNSATTVLDNTPSWGMSLSADTTNGALSVTVNGAAATSVRFSATIFTSEIVYA